MIASASVAELITERRHEMEYDSRPQNLLSKAVDKVCEQNPRLVLMPYEQMKAAALELASQLTDDPNLRVRKAFDLIAQANGVTILSLPEMESLVNRALAGEFDRALVEKP